MNTPQQAPKIYQLKIWIKKISPMIWRRLLITGSCTIAQLHYCIQIIFTWSDTHLHRFIIYGKSYGLSYIGGMDFTDDANEISLEQFQFRLNEHFMYQYDFSDNWECEIRIEKLLEPNPKKQYPFCISGNRCAPPEDCGGPEAFMQLLEQFPLGVNSEMLDMLDEYQDDEEELDAAIEEIYDVKRTRGQNKFDKKLTNKRLTRHFNNQCDDELSIEEVINEH